MKRFLYSSLLYLIAPFQFLNLWQRGKTLPGYRQRWGERLGRIPKLETAPRIWLHAVSVGEVNAAVPLIENLLATRPDYKLLVTTTTPTGSEQLKRRFSGRIEHFYFPYDLPHVIRRFLKRSNPDILVVMETELWPNCFHICRKKNVPVVIANARISDKSYRGYKKVKRWIEPAIKSIDHIAAQGETDRDRFICLGVPAEKVEVAGNIKFDLPPPTVEASDPALDAIKHADRPIWIGASTHDNEEERLLKVHQALRLKLPDALLILVPRHPERFAPVADQCLQSGLKLARRSHQEIPDSECAVYLGDSMGELMKLYAVSQVAFIGGSLVSTGGHNPIEPASLGIPVLSGPNTQNLRDIYNCLVEADGCRIVEDENALYDELSGLLTHPELRDQLSTAALSFLDASRGAVVKLQAMIENHLR